MARLYQNARGDFVPLWASLAEPVCHACMLEMMDEAETREYYLELVRGGLSDYEARGSAWPDETPAHHHENVS